jgi:hypothetical protein
MPNSQKATDAQLIDAYALTGSIWKTAAELGMCGQSVWGRLKGLGVPFKHSRLTKAEISTIRLAYEQAGRGYLDLKGLAAQLGRDKAGICGLAKKMGLTSLGRPKPPEAGLATSTRMKLWHLSHVHPRGASKPETHILKICPSCGRFFDSTKKSRQRFCNRRCAYMRPPPFGGNYAKSGKRADLGDQYFRSRWEANYARYLNWLIQVTKDVASWSYESETFEFKGIKRGTRFYTPDFRVQLSNGTVEYHEVKGWRYPKGETALKRMAKYYPHVRIVVVDSEWFKAVRRQGLPSLIEGWETQ